MPPIKKNNGTTAKGKSQESPAGKKKEEGWIIVFHNGLDTEEFDSWLHHHHFPNIAKLDGVTSVRRLSIIQGDSTRKYVALIRSEDIDATVKAVNGEEGKNLIRIAGENGVSDRQFFFCKTAFALEH